MPHATRPGDVLADRYRLVDLLTESGDGRFWRAHDRVLERHVAIHVIRSDDRRAPGLMEAARRSATVLDRRILRVLDADITDSVCYVVNEWGWGASLDIVAAGTGPLGPRRAAWLVAEVADSIATAHRAGVVHGRLNPENVLIDRTGGVRIIGLCVDAALHGVVTDDPRHDLTDLAGLLHCALTGTWGGASDSIVKPAPREHGEVLRPRRVRAGVPKSLDSLCEDLLHPEGIGRHRELEAFASSARGVADFLADFVGDPTGMAVALLASTPPVLPDEELVVLPQVPEMTVHESARATRADDPCWPAAPASLPDADNLDQPTEAGLPIFDDITDDVSWLERRSTPAPPPPPFEEPPERPLFAPEPTDGAPLRRSRPGASASVAPDVRPGDPRGRDEYWPWDTGTGPGSASSTSGTAVAAVEEEVPGRWGFRIGALLTVALIVAVGAVVAINRDRSDGSVDPGTPPSSSASDPAPGRTDPAPAGTPVEGVVAAPSDPLGDGAENDDSAPLAVDGDPATSWSTQGYDDQLGPGGLKTGVGLLLDLGTVRSVTAVDLALEGSPTGVSLYVGDAPPDGSRSPLVSQDVTGTDAELDLPTPTSGRYVLVWFTSLPRVDGVFRATVAEADVLADPQAGAQG